MFVLSACRVDTSVTVSVRDDGSGVVAARVVLDASAVKAAEIGGTKLEDAVRLGDLTAAGWKSSGWVRAKTGGATLTLTKGFARAPGRRARWWRSSTARTDRSRASG